MVGRKFTIFALFYFVFEGKFQLQAPQGAYIRRGDLTEGFLRYDFVGLIHGGANFRNFTVFWRKRSGLSEKGKAELLTATEQNKGKNLQKILLDEWHLQMYFLRLCQKTDE